MSGTAPGGLDLPMPADPSPRAGVPLGLDAPLPTPAQPGSRLPPAPDLPMPAAVDLPAPAESNLPMPAEVNLPVPAQVDLLTPSNIDLPQPVDLDLEPAHILPEPANLDVEPAQILPTPADLDVEPREHGLLEPRDRARAPTALPVNSAAHVGTSTADEVFDHRRSPTPKALPGQGVSRGLLYGGAALILVVGLGAGLVFSGVFDPDDVIPGISRGKTSGDAKAKPPGEATERADAVLTKFAADDPRSYQAGLETAQNAGDVVGKAEAALLLHLRYGPDLVLAGEAASLLKPYAAQTDPFVQRVVGLGALSQGDFAAADAALVGDGARTRLYRGWLRLAQGKSDEALAEAQAVLGQRGDELGALHLQHEARLERDPAEELKAIDASVAAHPNHPGLKELLVLAGIASGHLRKARETIAQIEPAENATNPYKARVLALQGRLALATGDLGGAIRDFEASAQLAAGDTKTQVAHAKALMKAGEFGKAADVAETLLQASPALPDANFLLVEIAIQTGAGDKALEQVTKLQEALPDRPEVPHLLGQIHGMRVQLDEGSKAFAAAMAKDPTYYQAAISESEMLANARRHADAVSKLDAAITHFSKQPAAAARLQVAKARLLILAGQSRAAIAALDNALVAAPGDNEAQVLRGVTRLSLGERASGKTDLMTVYERTGGYPGLVGPLGRILALENKVEELAQLVGDRADDPRASAEIKLVGARLRLSQARVDDAKTLIDQALSAEPGNWEGHLLMGQAFLDGGDYPAALEELDRAQPKTPQSELHLLRGKVLEFLRRHNDARPQYMAALEVDPNNLEARFLLGRWLSHGGAPDLAIKELLIVTSKTDRFPEAWLNLGRSQRELGKKSDAIKSLGKAVKLDRTLYEAHYWMGRLHFQDNQFSAAIANLKKATDIAAKGQPWYADAWQFLGNTHVKTGSPGKAKAAYEKFLEVAPATHTSRAAVEKSLQSLR